MYVKDNLLSEAEVSPFPREAVVVPLFKYRLSAAPAPTVPAFATPPEISRKFEDWFAVTFTVFPTFIVALPTFASVFTLFI